MNDQGYTLAETLVAVMILALAIGGLSWGTQTLTRWQIATAALSDKVTARRAAQTALERFLSNAGPFRSDKDGAFSGAPSGFTFDCGQAAPCAVTLALDANRPVLQLDDRQRAPRRLPLPATGDLHFVYRSGVGNPSSWPPALGVQQVLASVAVVTADAAPLLDARLWRQEPGVCAFDAVLQDCR